MKKEEAIQKAIEKTQNGCDLLYYPVVCEGTVIDGVEEMSSALDNYQKKLAEHTDMWIICEMAKRWLEYLRDKKKSKKTPDIIDLDNKWIPCSERLPKNIDLVLVTWENTNPEPYYKSIKGKKFCGAGHYCNGKWFWESNTCQDYLAEYGKCDWDEMDEAIKVIAWMPLPEPYREEARE